MSKTNSNAKSIGEKPRTGIPANIQTAKETAPEGATVAAITAIAAELDDSDVGAAELWRRRAGERGGGERQ